MFNFFDEIKDKIGKNHEFLSDYNLINISGDLLYVEGHKGLTVLSTNMIAFKVKKGRVVVDGENLFLKELTENTILIQGKISKMEIF